MNQHIFRGTEPECYLKYKEYCKKQTPTPTKNQIIQTPRIFQRERRAFHIGIEKGYEDINYLFYYYLFQILHVVMNIPVLNILK